MTLKPATLEHKPPAPPYLPSWVDRLNGWVSRLPIPAWVFYLVAWLLLAIFESATRWLDGVQPVGEIWQVNFFYTFYGIYFLAAIHYLDAWAAKSFETFRQTLEVDRAGQYRLQYSLTTMPARAVWVLTAATSLGFLFFIKPVIYPLWEVMGFEHSSLISSAPDLLIFYFNAIAVVVFVYHTIRQLRWVSRIHESATRIDLFQARPLYALSGLTARTAGILLLVGMVIQQQTSSHGVFTTDPYVLQVGTVFPIVSMVLYSVLAAASFLLPLQGLHQVLVREKERLQAEASSRLQVHLQELHRRIDGRQLEEADAIHHLTASLTLERDILAKLPTWPWQSGTLNLILTAVLFPILLFVVQQLLQRWF
jgi:hypothetical protein